MWDPELYRVVVLRRYTHGHTHISRCIYENIYTPVYVSIYIYIYLHVYWMCVYMCTCMYMHTHICVYSMKYVRNENLKETLKMKNTKRCGSSGAKTIQFTQETFPLYMLKRQRGWAIWKTFIITPLVKPSLWTCQQEYSANVWWISNTYIFHCVHYFIRFSLPLNHSQIKQNIIRNKGKVNFFHFS